MTNIKNYKDIIFYTFVFIIILSGIFLRLKVFELNIPFWFDEAFLGINFFDKNYIDFFNGISDYTKVPPLWAVFVKLILQTFGYSVKTFRLLPLISSIISLFAFFILLKNIFNNKLAILTGMIIFTLNYWVIFFSSDFKPYSSDILICILLLLSYKYISFKKFPPPRAFLYTAISIILILFSFPSIIVIPAMIITKCIEEKHFNHKCLLIFFGIFITCIYLYFIDKNCYQFMKEYWSSTEVGFWNFSVSSFNNLIYNFFDYIFILNKNTLTIYLNMFLSILGLILFIKDKQKIGYLFLFCFLINLSLSLFKFFPFGHRHGTYLIPIVTILLVKIFNLPNLIKTEQNYKKLLKYFSIIIIFIIILISTNTISRFRFNADFEKYMYLPQPRQVKFLAPDYFRLIDSNYETGDIVLLPNEIFVICNFYNYLYKRDMELIVLPEGNSQELVDIIRNQYKTRKLYIIGKFKSFSLSPDIDFIETEFKKLNIKYKIAINEYFYSFHTL